MTRALMVMGTGSDVGKSVFVAGLCRAFTRRGLRLAPFKPQNMSNNAAVTADGGEIGRAQALQARAAKREPLTAMNPVLLKPEGERGSQLVVRGKRRGSMAAREYFRTRGTLMPEVLAAFRELAADSDLVLVEGAGSASEINLRKGDLANFGFAEAADVPVLLLADIERGGVIAAIAGTFVVVAADDRARLVGSVVNKFRGDPRLFDDGLTAIAKLTGRPALGPVPWFPRAAELPAEDSLALGGLSGGSGDLHVVAPRLPSIANFDDLDPIRLEPGVRFDLLEPDAPIPASAGLIVLPGSKATRRDLAALREAGWDIDIRAAHRRGVPVLGLCGGYQMLGRTVADPDGVEGDLGTSEGLGLLAVDTVLTVAKTLARVEAEAALFGLPLSGYRMHMGSTDGPDRARPFARIEGIDEGAVSADGTVMGTYLHGIFAADGFRRAFLNTPRGADFAYEANIEAVLDELAAHLETHLDLDLILSLAREVNP
jgi:adenosylcobyric acid synthase